MKTKFKKIKNNFRTKVNNSKKTHKKISIWIKLILILILVLAFYYTNNSNTNTISLLAVNENNANNISTGSIVELSLKIKPGSGNTYVNLNTLEEIDTQISIINSKKITCKLFKFDCNNYDFYYNFKGSALILKGPSASSAIAILTAKTFKGEKINRNIVITGSLNSGGLIGNVGGIDTKIKVAKKLHFKKVLIPFFSTYNKTNAKGIKVVKVIDIIEAYNNFNSKKYILKTYPINKTNYILIMKNLGTNLCERTNELKNQINFSSIKNNSVLNIYEKVGNKSFNSSIIAQKNHNYYSQGSFCYNGNINYKILIEKQKNYSEKNLDESIKKINLKINLKLKKIQAVNYRKKITNINDFYIYLILNNRINEASNFIKEINKINITYNNLNLSIKNKINITVLINNTNISENNNNNNNSINKIKNISNILNLNKSKIQILNKNVFNEKLILYSYAVERFYTVGVWEKAIGKSNSSKINFNDKIMTNACDKLIKEITIKEQILNTYKILYFNSQIEKQRNYYSPFSNKYSCLYDGLELNAKINTILNSVGIKPKNLKLYSQKLRNFTKTRISTNSNGNFPLIPFIYYEYSGDLFNQGDFQTSMLYSNYVLSYSDLNLYLKTQSNNQEIINVFFNSIFENYLFMIGILFLIAFI